jgi:hypothetical protein
MGVHPHSQQFLRFIWQGHTYQFRALPFGLNTAPRIFTKLLKPVVAFLSTRNIRLLILYLEILKYILIIDNFAKGSHNSSNRFVAIPRIYNQLQEVGLDAFPRTRIPGVLDKLENNEFLPTSGEDSKSTQCRQIFKQKNPTSLHLLSQFQGILEYCRPAVWVAPLHFRHIQSCLIIYTANSVEQEVISGHGPPRPPSSGGTPVVDHQHQTGEWEPNSASSDRNDDHFGRLQNGVGCHLR